MSTPRPGRRFRDRREAGDAVAEVVARRLAGQDVVVLGLPRGGVPVAAPVARRLGAPLDVLVVRKLGVPGQPELAMGAIASGGVVVIEEDIVGRLGLRAGDLERVAEREREELARREVAFRGDRPMPPVAGRTVVLVDDGIATGATTRAAVRAARMLGPSRVVVAVPTASVRAVELLEREADEVIAVDTPEPYVSVGWWYDEFTQTTDDEVRDELEAARRNLPQPPA